MKSDPRRSRLTDFPTFKDNLVEHPKVRVNLDLEFEASGVECYSFRLKSPNCNGIFKDGKYYDNRANRSFLARAYKRVHRPQSQIVIMYNGLDETIHTAHGQLFSFYDELGVRLASAGKLAILLPTPYHMNRALAYADTRGAEQLRQRNVSKFVRMHIPSEALTSEPSKIYVNHFQGCKETLELCRFFLGAPVEDIYSDLHYQGIVPERIAGTIRSWVSKSPSIALLGYSLGGLRALTEFLFDRRRAKRDGRAPLFSGCVAVCSGGSLSDLAAPPWIDPVKWKKMIDNLVTGDADNLLNSARSYFPDEEVFSCEYFQTLRDIFLGNAHSMRLLGSDAAKAARSMLFLLGGADTLVPPESIRRINPEGGVNILQVSGLGHLFSYDIAWNAMKILSCDVVAQFLDNVPTLQLLPDPEELIQLLVLLELSLGFMPYKSVIKADVLHAEAQSLAESPLRSDLLEKILGKADAKNIELKLEAETARKMFRDFVVEQLDDLALQLKRQVVNPALFWPEWEKHFLDGILYRDAGLRQDVIEIGDHSRDERLDVRMVQNELLTSKRRDKLFELQENRLKPIRLKLRDNFCHYSRMQLDQSVPAKPGKP